MKLSVTTYPWRRIATPRQLSTVLGTIKRIGYEGVGLEYAYLPPAVKAKPGILRDIMKRSGLENGGTFSPGALTRIGWARDSGTPLIWLSIYARDSKTAMDKLRRFVATAKENGVTASLHNEVRSAFQTTSDLKRAMKSNKDLTLCLDTAHGTAAGVDIEGAIEEYAGRISLIHLKDFVGGVPLEKVKFTRDFVNVGRGVVNLQAAVDKLKQTGYNGELMVEVEANQREKPSDVVKEGYVYAKSLL